MFTQSLWVTYICKLCKKQSIASKKLVSLIPITHTDIIVSKIREERASKCLSCDNPEPLQISEIECKLIPCMDDYGSTTNNGHWACSLIHTEYIYPIPLKRAVEKPPGRSYHSFEKYNSVAANGYPWKCPVCKKLLDFIPN